LLQKEHQQLSGAYAVDHILRCGRKDQVAYTWFVNVYLPCAVPRGVKGGLDTLPPSKVFTIGDEVMVLWFLENSWDVWADMKKRGDMKTSEVEPEYTISGDKSGGENGPAGWTERGKHRFNDLFDMVEASRRSKDGKAFDDYYVSTRNQGATKKKKKTRHATTTQPLTTKNTLAFLCGGSLNNSLVDSNYVTPRNGGVQTGQNGEVGQTAAV
jgi:hypothetical protein